MKVMDNNLRHLLDAKYTWLRQGAGGQVLRTVASPIYLSPPTAPLPLTVPSLTLVPLESCLITLFFEIFIPCIRQGKVCFPNVWPAYISMG